MNIALNAIWMLFLAIVCGEECLDGVALLDCIWIITGANGLLSSEQLHVQHETTKDVVEVSLLANLLGLS